jgi:hypothetical protein
MISSFEPLLRTMWLLQQASCNRKWCGCTDDRKIAKALSNFANKPFAVSKSTGVLAD